MDFIKALLSRKKSSPDSGQGSRTVSQTKAQEIQLIGNEDGSVLFAFGMNWRTLIKGGGLKDAQAFVSKNKGTHFIFRDNQIGYGMVRGSHTPPIYSASSLAGKSCIGAAIYAIKMAERKYWICIVRDGKPTQNDEILEGSEGQAVDRVRRLFELLGDSRATVFSDISRSGLENVKPFSLSDVLEIPRTQSDALQKIIVSKASIPTPVLVIGTVVMLGLGSQKGYQYYQEYQKEKAHVDVAVEDSPEVAWKPVVDEFINKTSYRNPSSVLNIKSNINQLPILWMGWMMEGLRCTSGDLVQDKITWSCVANYKRTAIGLTSMAMREVVTAKFADRGIAFPGINDMNLTWSISSDGEKMIVENLGKASEMRLRILSEMQSISRALTEAPSISVAAVLLNAPKRKDGSLHPVPPSVPNFQVGQVRIKGPMRSIDTAFQKFPEVNWDSIGLVIDLASSPSQKDIKTSSLIIEMTGNFYAVN
jgi:hypothetical protein